MHRVTSPPALEESPGVWGASKRPSGLWVLSAGGKYRAAGSYRKDSCVEQVSVSCTWYVVLCQPERGNFKNPQFQPHIFFSSRRKENVPLTVQKIGAAAPCIAQPPLAAALSAEQKGGRGSRRDMVRPPPNPRASEGCGPYGVRLTVAW